jgi:HD-like signal output (HDOD) protein
MTSTLNVPASLPETIAASVNIPAQPTLLMAVQQELQKEDPDPRVVSSIVVKDVAMSAALVRMANSAAFGGRRQVDSLAQAISYLGLRHTIELLTSLLLKNTPELAGPQMPRFWDAASKRALAMRYMARKTFAAEVDVAYTCGLFCDIGIALLMRKFDTYVQTLAYANGAQTEPFLVVENARHGTNHAVVGAMMARAWGLSDTVVQAIRLHHDYDALEDGSVAAPVRELSALLLLADRAVQSHRGLNKTVEWEKGGAQALGVLMVSPAQFDELADAIHELFDSEEASQ